MVIFDKIDELSNLKADIVYLDTEIARVRSIMAEYKAGYRDIQGIRLFSRLHQSFDLNLQFYSIDELLESYKNRLVERREAKMDMLLLLSETKEETKQPKKRWWQWK